MTKPDFSQLYSDRSKQMKASEIRELLKLTHRPNIISFAGGLPNPETFPTKEIVQLIGDANAKYGKVMFQYGTTEGVTRLREQIAERLHDRWRMDVKAENVLIVSGSQQGLYMVGKMFINNADPIIVGAPTYLGALQAFRTFRPTFHAVELDDHGMIPERLEETLQELKGKGKTAKFIYLVPTFQNPTGVTLPKDRRKHILELAEKYNTIVIEDDPYGELRYEGSDVPPMHSMDGDGRVLYMGTFSKIMVPGFRLAYCAGDKDLIQRMVIAKQGMDLCTNTFTQYLASEFMEREWIAPHIEEIKALYGRKRNLMLNALDEYAVEGMTWTKPLGGMFLWVRVHESCDTEHMFIKALEQGIAYVHGAAFYPYREIKNAMRLNFSFATDPKIVEGVQRLCKVIKENCRIRC